MLAILLGTKLFYEELDILSVILGFSWSKALHSTILWLQHVCQQGVDLVAHLYCTSCRALGVGCIQKLHVFTVQR